jgi:hypothetical protein
VEELKAVFYLVMLALYAAYHFLSPKARVRRALSRVEATPVRKLTEGHFRITGTVQASGDLLTAPVSRRPCLAYELHVEKREKFWTDVIVRRDARPFRVVDGAGLIEVHPDGHYDLALVEDHKGNTGWFAKRDEAAFGNFIAILREEGISLPQTPFSTKALRYREGAIEEGERVTVSGRVVREVRADGERADFRSVPEVVVLRGTSEEPLQISDEPVVTG